MRLPTNNKEYSKWLLSGNPSVREIITEPTQLEITWADIDKWICSNYYWLSKEFGVSVIPLSVSNGKIARIFIDGIRIYDVNSYEEGFGEYEKLLKFN